MPEISEVARIVHFLRKNLLNKTLKKVTAAHDEIVFGKVGTSGAEIEKALTGKKVVDVGRQGKYFWLIMSSPPHPVMHFGMSGWFKFQDEHTFYYQPKPGKEETEWPPKFWKFHVEAEGTKKGDAIKGAFVDMRRLARVRLVDCDGKEIRKHSPLKENGPDPVLDKSVFTLDWLREKCKKKKVPIKAMLLDQAVISGIGNWVGDEIMYHSKIHPEQYANTLQDSQVKQLFESINYVCDTACELLADSDKFPEEWLFKHRWGKGKKKTEHILPNGEKIVFLTVGGRTSAVVPSVQKKTGPVAKDVDEDDLAEDDVKEEKPKRAPVRKRMVDEDDESDEDVEMKEEEKEETTKPKKTSRGKKAQTNGVKDEGTAEDEEKKPAKRRKTAEAKVDEPKADSKPAPKKATKKAKPEVEDTGRRRSTRTRK